MRSKILYSIWGYLIFAVILGTTTVQVLISVAWVDLYSMQNQVLDFLTTSLIVAPFGLLTGLIWPITLFPSIYAVIISAGTGYIPETWLSPIILFALTILIMGVTYGEKKYLAERTTPFKATLVLTSLIAVVFFTFTAILYPVSLILRDNLIFLGGTILIIIGNLGLIYRLGEHKGGIHTTNNLLLRGILVGANIILTTGCIGLIVVLEPTMSFSYLILTLYWYSIAAAVAFLLSRGYNYIRKVT